MKRTSLCLMLITVILLSVFHHPTSASSGKLLDKPGVLQLLQETYDTQYSLTERYHTWEEAKGKLTKYMTDELAETFMVEHLFEEEEGYMFYGTDFSMFIIPEYSYDDQTMIVVTSGHDTIYVYEQSSSTGPVTYSAQYEIVTIQLMDEEWKVSNISFEDELPEEVKQAKDLDQVTETAKTTEPDSLVQVQHNVERLNDIPTESISQLNMAMADVSSFDSYQPFVSLVPYHLLFQNVNIDQQRPLFLTFSTIISGNGKVQ